MYDDNENHPLQPFPLVVFCVVFFLNKLNKHSHPNSRSGGVNLILGVQVEAFNRWEAFILVTYFNELNITVYSMLSAKNFFVLTESRLRAWRLI